MRTSTINRKVRALLKQRESNHKHADELRADVTRKVDAFRKRLEADLAPQFRAFEESNKQIAEQLSQLNPFRVGTHIQGLAADNQLGGPIYQVTSVADHETLWARQITARGKLGAEAHQFKNHKTAYGFGSKNLSNFRIVGGVSPAPKKG